MLNGEFKFRVGEETLTLKTGDSLFGLQRVPHTFVKISEGPARLLHHQPAGQMKESFVAGSQMENSILEQQQINRRKYGMIPAGPPLTPD